VSDGFLATVRAVSASLHNEMSVTDVQFHNIEQRSKEWHEKRLRMPTASQFHRIVTPTGNLSKQWMDYGGELLYQRITGQQVPKRVTDAMQRGIDCEPDALAAFQQKFPEYKIDPGGFVTDGRMGCSPDAVINHGNERMGVEIKVPMPWNHATVLAWGVGDDYKAQVQGQMLVGGFNAVHLYVWSPPWFEIGKQPPAFHLRTERDEKYIERLREALEEFCLKVDLAERRIRTMEGWK
jgi:hypothetical protein